MKKMRQQQQGDVCLQEVVDIPSNAKKTQAKNARWILAEGEATGHAHAICEVEDVEMYERDGTYYIKASQPVSLVHEEHHTQTIEPGNYQIGIVREKDYLSDMVRHVVD